MILFRTCAPSLSLGAALLGAVIAMPLQAGEYVDSIEISSAGRCAQFGPGFVDVGNGMCSRTRGYVRVDPGTTRNVGTFGWTGGGTSNAALRSETPTMVPGAGDRHHLRVRNNLDSYSPFK